MENFKMSTWQYFLTKLTDYQRKSGSDRNGNTNYGRQGFNQKSKIDKILTVTLEGHVLDREEKEILLYFDFGLHL